MIKYLRGKAFPTKILNIESLRNSDLKKFSFTIEILIDFIDTIIQHRSDIFKYEKSYPFLYIFNRPKKKKE